MGASRKLQGEIDRVLKKVQEGVEVFDSIWNKVYDTDNANQKEKFEADLKKEIKKLQRYRDQIKTWIQSSEIKDKKALLDARKLIEREMERFKVCEKETKTKAFSKEGLVQQPKTDPKEKAKSETRDWVNNVVGELESQINYFEADIEGLSVKKGKTRPPRLAHLEASVARHKAHIMKLEVILRLLDNDEFSPEQVNDVRDFLEDYVERNQEDFDEFSDVDELYNTLPLEKVEALEDLVAINPGIAKESRIVRCQHTPSMILPFLEGTVPPEMETQTVGTTALSLKTSAPSGTHLHASSSQQSNISQDQADETGSHDSNSDTSPRTPPSNSSSSISTSISATAPGHGMTTGVNTAANGSNVLPRAIGGSSTSGILSSAGSIQSSLETSTATPPPSSASLPATVKEDDNACFPGSRSSPSLSEVGLGRSLSRGPVSGITLGQASNSVPLTSGNAIPVSGSLGTVLGVSDLAKQNLLVTDERIGGGVAPSLDSPLASRILLPQIPKTGDVSASTELSNTESGTVGGRIFSPMTVTGIQWRPPSANSFQSQNETFRGRTEIAPDQREKFLLRLQQVQQGHNLLGVSHLSGVNNMAFPAQPQNSLLQQLNARSSALSSQPGLGLGLQAQGPSALTSVPQQLQNSLQQASPSQHVLVSPAPKDIESTSGKLEDIQQQRKLTDNDSNTDPVANAGQNKNLTGEDDLKSSFSSEPPIASSGSLSEVNHLPRDSDFSPGQPLPSPQSSADLGVIGRRSSSDLGTIGDNLGGSSANPGHDQMHNLQMLEGAYFKVPHAKDSECPKNYVPKRPAVTPSSYPQVQAPIVNNPAFWERVAADNYGTDTLFFSFYFQQSTYQQYLAARELKKQSWRYHKKYNTWFQRHEEPKVTTDDYEQGTYVYFDFHISNDDYGNQQQQGWCQRIKTEFTFEYSYLEDELV